jgi:hypothetical protein
MRGKRLSVKQLSALLVEHGFVPAPFTARKLPAGITSEVFGKDARLFFWTEGPEKRAELERFLARQGIAFDPNYFPGSGMVEVGVRYFKGWHWGI